MAEGWIKLHRQIVEHPLWPSDRRFTKLEAWLDLVLRANFKDSRLLTGGQIILVQRGQVFTSQVSLAKRWRWDRSSVIGFLRLLKQDSQIDIQTSTKTNSGFTLITICNYEKYQAGEEHETNSQNHSQPHSETNSQVTATQQPSNTSEECKECKEERAHSRVSTRAGKTSPNPDVKAFIDWWCQEFAHRLSEPYAVSGAKEGATVKRLLQSRTLPDLQAKAIQFFEGADEWVERNGGFTIGVFASQINKLVSANGRRGSTVRDFTAERRGSHE